MKFARSCAFCLVRFNCVQLAFKYMYACVYVSYLAYDSRHIEIVWKVGHFCWTLLYICVYAICGTYLHKLLRSAFNFWIIRVICFVVVELLDCAILDPPINEPIQICLVSRNYELQRQQNKKKTEKQLWLEKLQKYNKLLLKKEGKKTTNCCCKILQKIIVCIT